MKREQLQCDIDGRKGVFQVFRGQSADGYSAFHFQAFWLWQERGGRLVEESNSILQRRERFRADKTKTDTNDEKG